MKTAIPANIDEYIAGFPKDVQKILHEIRATIKKAAPDAREAIKYAMPAFILHGNLIYFAGCKNHIGIYPVPKGNESLKKELAAYQHGKGTLQFPLDKPMPLKFLAKVVKLRIQENLEKAEKKIALKKRR